MSTRSESSLSSKRKKNNKLRIILDTRVANTFLNKPRASHLPTPSAWCSLEVEEEDTLYTASGDVTDAFHRMQLPQHLRFFPTATNSVPASPRISLASRVPQGGLHHT